MKCRTCDYELWNLTDRTCPECGTPFQPSEYEFVPNTVEFRCPDCGKVFFGQDQKGHPPRGEITCECGFEVDADRMVLRPREGVRTIDTVPFRHPWLMTEDHGTWVRWWRTVKKALVAPHELGRDLPGNARVRDALRFLWLTALITSIGQVLPVLCVGGAFILPLVTRAGVAPGSFGMLLVMFVLVPILSLISLSLMLFLWAFVTHLLLRISGETAGGFGRTLAALSYAAGAFVISVIPVCGGNVAPVWVIVSGTLGLKEAQRVTGLRATLATVLPPVLGLGLFVAAYVGVILLVVANASTWATPGVHRATRALVEHAARDGAWPDHAVRLLDDGMATSDFESPGRSMTQESRIPVGDGVLTDWYTVFAAQESAWMTSIAASLPKNARAYRVGDLVFTYPGVPIDDPDLWVVVWSPDPDANASPWNLGLEVGLANGETRGLVYNRQEWAGILREQNARRAQVGLEPLPDPWEITHDDPLVAK